MERTSRERVGGGGGGGGRDGDGWGGGSRVGFVGDIDVVVITVGVCVDIGFGLSAITAVSVAFAFVVVVVVLAAAASVVEVVRGGNASGGFVDCAVGESAEGTGWSSAKSGMKRTVTGMRCGPKWPLQVEALRMRPSKNCFRFLRLLV